MLLGVINIKQDTLPKRKVFETKLQEMKKIFILIIFGLVMCSLVSAQSRLPELDKVKEIKLLESNRDDVRRIFAGYKFRNYNLSDYRDSVYTKDAEVEFSYSEGKCEDEGTDGVNVVEGRVSYVEISLKKTIKLKDIENQITEFGGELSTYRKEKMYVNENDSYMLHNKDLGIGLKLYNGRVEEVTFILPKKYYSLICNAEIARRLTTTKSFFTRPLKERKYIRYEPTPTGVKDLILSLTEIMADCSQTNSEGNKICSDKVKAIDVLAVSYDSEIDDVLAFNYTVTGGKVIGTGNKVIWDLSGVKPGTYKITAEVDDGCGVCGQPVTKEVKVIECPNCLEEDH